MKSCEYCGKPMQQQPGQKNVHWRNQRFCGRSCLSKAQYQRARAERGFTTPDTKRCPRCKKVMRRGSMAEAGWVLRVYCSVQCKNAAAESRKRARLRAAKEPKAIERTYDPRDTYRRQGLQPLEAIPAHLKARDLDDALRTAFQRHGMEFVEAFEDQPRARYVA